MVFCGIDEAGKGSVLGPMVTGGILVSDLAELDGLGIRDSKQLTPKKREALFAEITGSWKTHAVIKTPQDIDSREGTMNAFTAACHAEVLRALHPDTAYLDACDVNAERFGKNVLRLSGIQAAVISEHKADARHMIVGAASIVAKVTRDHCIEELCSEFGMIGSGYPSDPATIAFLTDFIRANGKPPACARVSWQTTADILARAAQKSLEEFF
ncbi:MAG: ribonuclease HII [Methanocorpusculum sp.]|nr:ribonuclease HII [Methanocorpusculum sp.]